MEKARLVIEAKQKRADQPAAALVAEAAHHAIGCAPALDLEHGVLASPVGQVEALGDNSVDRGVAAGKPLFGNAQIAREWGEGQADRAIRLREEAVQDLAAL